MPPPAACTQRLIFLFGSFGEGWARASGEALQAAGFGDAIQSRVRWTDLEELTLLAEMAAVGITWEEGTELPWATSFMPFAATVMHLFRQRNQRGIAAKVRSLLLRGPLANSIPHGNFSHLRQSVVRWSEMEELTLLDEMERAGIARTREQGAKVPGDVAFMPFAAKVEHRFAQRTQMGIASKVRQLLISGRASNKMHGDTEERTLLETSQLRRGDLKDRVSIKYTDLEERTLLAEMAAAGIAREDGAEVPGWSTCMHFAATVMHLFGEHRRQTGIAHKVQQILLNGPRANKTVRCGAGSGATGLVGVYIRKDTGSQPRPLPPLVCWPALRRCTCFEPAPHPPGRCCATDPLLCDDLQQDQVQGDHLAWWQSSQHGPVRHRP